MAKKKVRGKSPPARKKSSGFKMKWALISVYNKDGIVDFAKRLRRLRKGGFIWNIVSSGGTAKALREAGVIVVDVGQITGLEPMLDHRVATLHPRIHAGLLADFKNDKHLQEMLERNWDLFDLVCVDFYPMANAISEAAAISDPVAARALVVKQTDIGGPTLVRSGAKGLRIVVCTPADRAWVLDELEMTGSICTKMREWLAANAENEVANYVGMSADFLGQGRFKHIAGERVDSIKLKYGENASQAPAVLFRTDSAKGDPLALENFKQEQGTDPSFINVADIDRLLQTITHISQVFWRNWRRTPHIAVAVKHGNACGASVGYNKVTVLEKMVLGDPLAIFGGFVMTNFKIGNVEANMLLRAGLKPEEKNRIYDGVVAPAFFEDAVDMLARKATQKCRLITNLALDSGNLPLDTAPRFRYVRGGFMTQPNYTYVLKFDDLDMFTIGKFSQQAKEDLALAWAISTTSNSNTITIGKNGGLLGNGVGRQSRVGAARLAVSVARESSHNDELVGASACSDSFAPFPDAIEKLWEAGVKNIFTTSGAKADKEIQRFCFEHDINLLMLSDAVARGFFGH